MTRRIKADLEAQIEHKNETIRQFAAIIANHRLALMKLRPETTKEIWESATKDVFE